LAYSNRRRSSFPGAKDQTLVNHDEEVVFDEVFVGIPAFPNYVISNYGRVVNIATNYELKLSQDQNGYYRAVLYKDGKRCEFGVHRLVARAFFLNWKPGVEVYHINGDQSDNSVLNLTLGQLKVRGGSIDPWEEDV
jgi:hypothetical protein